MNFARMWRSVAKFRTAAMLLLLPVFAYSWYVMLQWRRLNEFNQREIANAARILEATVTNAVTNVENLELARIGDFLNEQPYLKDAGSPAKGCSEVGSPSLTSRQGQGLFIAAEQGKCKLTLEFNTAKLFSELSFPESFPSIFLADSKGRVAVQFTDGQRRWHRDLLWAERSIRTAVDTAGAMRLNDLSHLMSSNQSEFNKVKGASARVRTVLGGEYYQLYLTPVRFAVSSSDELKEAWVLGGLVAQEQLLQKAFAVDRYLLGTIILLTLAIVLGWPFLKLTVLQPREHFRMWDVYRLYLSTGCLLTLFTVLLSALAGYWDFDQRADKDLIRLSHALEDNLEKEMLAAHEQLRDWDRLFASRIEADMVCPKLQYKERGDARCVPFAPPEKFANVQQVSWVNPEGKQVAKISTDKAKTELHPVGHRPYFRAIAEHLTWLFRDHRDRGSFFLHPLRSITDGRFYTFLSMKSEARIPSKDALDGKPSAAVMTLDLSSLGAQPLPSRFGFVLFNRQGDVLYHSDDRLSLRENLFEEVSRTRRVRSLVLAEQEDMLSLEYRSSAYQFYFRPVRKLVPRHLVAEVPAWYIATFRELSIPRSIAIHAVVASLVGLILLSQIVMGVPLLVLRALSNRFHGRCGTLLWPHDGNRQSFLWLSGALVVLLAVFLLAPSLRPFITVLAACLALAAWAWPISGRTNTAPALGWHLTALMLLAVHLAVLPSYYLFQMAWRHEFGKFAQMEAEQAQLLRYDLLQQSRNKAVMEGAPQHRIASMRDERGGFMLTTNTPPAGSSERAETPSDWLLRPYRFIASLMPVQNEVLGKLVYLPGNTRTVSSVSFAAAFYVPLLLLLAGLAGWIWVVSRKVFLSDLVARQPAIQAATGWETLWNQLTDDEKLLLTQIHKEGVANPRRNGVAAGLVARQYVSFEPDLRLAPGLAAYLTTHGPSPEQIHKWETAGGEGGWKQVRWILIGSLAVVGLFLFATQPDLTGQIAGLITFVTTIAGGALKMRDVVGGWLEKKEEGA